MIKKKFSCVMAYVINKKLRNAILSFYHSIPYEYLFEGKDSDGDKYNKLPEPHITILYGITTADINAIIKPFEDIHYINYKLEETDFFDVQDKKYMVLKIGVQSNDLDALNNRVKREVGFDSSFKEYHPHMTIAYLKKDDNVKNKYIKLDLFKNFRDVTNILHITTLDGHVYFYNLSEKELRKSK
jgi:hypothetical protein